MKIAARGLAAGCIALAVISFIGGQNRIAMSSIGFAIIFFGLSMYE